jgi:hypothetical protein
MALDIAVAQQVVAYREGVPARLVKYRKILTFDIVFDLAARLLVNSHSKFQSGRGGGI